MLLPALVLSPSFAANPADDEGFIPMFNGKDLTGWVNVNCAPSSFYVKDNEIVTTGKPTGYLRTAKQYENFVAEFDWMHVPTSPGAVANSGFFVWCDPIPAVGTGYTRGIEVQVLVNLTYKNKKGEITATSQGDLFSIWGATCVPDRPHPDGWARCLPSGDYCKGANEWNHYRVEANDGVIKLAVNGHVVSGLSKCKPRKGYLALESEGSECHFRNLRIKELPSTNPNRDEIADEDLGFKNLYTGVDLAGWDVVGPAKEHWHAQDYVLHFDGKGARGLRSIRQFGNGAFIIDCRFPAADARPCTVVLRSGEKERLTLRLKPNGRYTRQWSSPGGFDFHWTLPAVSLKPKEWNRLQVSLKGKAPDSTVLEVNLNAHLLESEIVRAQILDRCGLQLEPESQMDFANLFVRELK
jgi:hypothetical protein